MSAKKHTITIHYDPSSKEYSFNPQETDAHPKEIVDFNTDADCTVCFSPDNTVFGASLDVYAYDNPGARVTIRKGDDFTVQMCGAALNAACTPDQKMTTAAAGRILTATGSIKVGS